MALQTFAPPKAPDLGSGRDTSIRALTATFGDGYQQVAEDGLNAIQDSWTPTWSLLAVADADTIETFFKANGAAGFLWTPPRETAAKKWRCLKWHREADGPDTDKIGATFSQIFDIDG